MQAQETPAEPGKKGKKRGRGRPPKAKKAKGKDCAKRAVDPRVEDIEPGEVQLESRILGEIIAEKEVDGGKTDGGEKTKKPGKLTREMLAHSLKELQSLLATKMRDVAAGKQQDSSASADNADQDCNEPASEIGMAAMRRRKIRNNQENMSVAGVKITQRL